MRVLLLLLLACTLASLPSPPLRSQSPPTTPAYEKQGPAGLWRDRRQCGLNCVYLLLRVNGIDVDYTELLERTPIGPTGSTLVDLRDGAAGIGQELEILKGGPDDLAAAELPVIVHMDAFYSDQSRAGHYVVLTECNERGVRGFDGLTANYFELPIDRFYKCWSGYVVRMASPRFGWGQVEIVAFVVLLLSIAWVVGRRRRALPVEEVVT